MMRRSGGLWFGAWVLLLAGVAACGQGAGDVQRSLEAALKGKQLPIRGFFDASEIRYTWKSGRLEATQSAISTLGAFRMESVKVHAENGVVDRVTIRGTLRTVLKVDLKATDALSKSEEKITFDIALHDADSATLMGLASQVFYPDVASALADVPKEVVPFLPMFRKISQKGAGVDPNQFIRQADVLGESSRPISLQAGEGDICSRTRIFGGCPESACFGNRGTCAFCYGPRNSGPDLGAADSWIRTGCAGDSDSGKLSPRTCYLRG